MEKPETINTDIQLESSEIIKNVQDFINKYPYEIALVLVILGVIAYKIWSEKNNNNNNNIFQSKEDIPKIIWMYWNTPIEKSPEIVKILSQI